MKTGFLLKQYTRKKMQSNREKESIIKNIFSILQIVSIIFAALWSVYIFIQFEKSERILSIELLRFQKFQAVLSNNLTELAIEKNKLEIEQIKSQQIVFSLDINVTDIGKFDSTRRDNYLVEFQYSMENIGASQNEITYVAINSFLYSLPYLNNSIAQEIDFHIDDTRDHIFKKGFYYAPKWQKGMSLKLDSIQYFIQTKGGGGTSELDPGEISKGCVMLLVMGKPSDIIEFEMEVGINDGNSSENRWNLKKSTFLSMEV